jgi:hypothetical protein
VRDDLPQERREEAIARRLTFTDPGEVVLLDGDVAVVEFEQWTRIIRAEDLRVLTTVEEIPERRKEDSERARLDGIAQQQAYYTPETTQQAFNFGRRSAIHSHKRMRRHEFLATAGDHPYPSSLWRAYRLGFEEGKRVLAKRLEG